MLKFLLVLFIIYFIVRIFTRYFLRRFARNMQQNFEGRGNSYNKKKEGDVTVNAKPKKGKKIDKDEGDYVDYEEVN